MIMLDTIVKEIKLDQIQEYKKFFTVALETEEECFRISPEDEKAEPFPTQGLKDSFTLGAYIEEKLAAVVSFERDGAKREKLRHKGTLFRLYVSQEFRKLGLGKRLMEEVIERVRRDTDIEHINLTVVAVNHTAKQLYERYGFQVFSVEEHAIKWKGKYFTEEQMVLRLR